MKVMISLPDDFLAEIDRLAAEEKRTRSELLREAVRTYIAVREARRRPGSNPRILAAVSIQDELARASAGQGEDSTDEIRRWRETRR